MKTEVLIYAYLAVCAAMILFNIVCIFVFRFRDKRLERRSNRFIKIVERVIEDQTVTEDHCKYLFRKLKKTHHLMAFDKTLEEMSARDPQQIAEYLRQLLSVFLYLSLKYRKKNEIQAAYFSYIIHRHQVFRDRPVQFVMEVLLEQVHSPSLYVRENALQAIYSSGSEEWVLRALRSLDWEQSYHHPKMITDGLLNFTGDTQRLAKYLWNEFDHFSPSMQRVIVDYFRFSSPDHRERILSLLTLNPTDAELAYSCIRYLGKYPYAPAYPILLDFAEKTEREQWVYTAIAASALAGYPGDRTEAVLEKLLQNPNWHVRFNASQSLISLGLYYTDMIDIFEGRDRFASEIMRYRFDQKHMKEREAMGVGLGSQ